MRGVHWRAALPKKFLSSVIFFNFCSCKDFSGMLILSFHLFSFSREGLAPGGTIVNRHQGSPRALRKILRALQRRETVQPRRAALCVEALEDKRVPGSILSLASSSVALLPREIDTEVQGQTAPR